MTGLSAIAVGLRFYARKQQKARYLTDDWMVISALVSLLIRYTKMCFVVFANRITQTRSLILEQLRLSSWVCTYVYTEERSNWRLAHREKVVGYSLTDFTLEEQAELGEKETKVIT